MVQYGCKDMVWVCSEPGMKNDGYRVIYVALDFYFIELPAINMGGKEFSGGDNNRDALLFLLDAIKMERPPRA